MLIAGVGLGVLLIPLAVLLSALCAVRVVGQRPQYTGRVLCIAVSAPLGLLLLLLLAPRDSPPGEEGEAAEDEPNSMGPVWRQSCAALLLATLLPVVCHHARSHFAMNVKARPS